MSSSLPFLRHDKKQQQQPRNLCRQVRQSCLDWYQQHTSVVRIDDAALAKLAHEIQVQQQTTKKTTGVEWDEEGWHYHPPTDWPVQVRRERIALYILALDAINFCFWPCSSLSDETAGSSTTTTSDGYEYEHLAVQLTAMAQADHEQQSNDLTRVSPDYCLGAQSMQDMTVARMRDLFLLQRLAHKNKLLLLPPNLSERCLLWNQVGHVLLQHFDGSAWKLVQAANGSAVRAVQLLYDYLDGFRDVVHIKDNNDDDDTTDDNDASTTVYFLKRAQICVGDWQAALPGLQWHDTDQLTTFADYRLPQLLRQRGVLDYCRLELAQAVDNQDELPAGSKEEVSIRAATVVAVDRLVAVLNSLKQTNQTNAASSGTICATNKTWTAMSLDWYLWQVGERLDAQGKLAPHHRVQTKYY